MDRRVEKIRPGGRNNRVEVEKKYLVKVGLFEQVNPSCAALSIVFRVSVLPIVSRATYILPPPPTSRRAVGYCRHCAHDGTQFM